VRHAHGEDPGAAERWAADRGHAFSVWDPHDDGVLPGADSCDFVILLGGPGNTRPEPPIAWVEQERQLALDVVAGGGVALGICFGAQQLSVALGGSVRPNHALEVGWWPVSPTEAASESSLAHVLSRSWVPFHTHGQTFSIPDGAVNLLRSSACEHQAFEAFDGRLVALQFHPEMEFEQIADIASRHPQGPQPPSVQGPERYRDGEDVPQLIAEMHDVFWELLDTLAERAHRTAQS
jgi:GMP synthase-like glutamine amidotransferase